MRSWFRRLFAPSTPRPALRPRDRHFQPQIEFLERREVPAFTGGLIAIDGDLNVTEIEVVTASSANGSKVAVWMDNNTNDNDILAQQFDANGIAVGGIITVANNTDEEFDPDVAMDANGNFVVVWTRDFLGSGDLNIEYAIFNSSGAETASGEVAARDALDESNGKVAMNGTGTWVCAFEADALNGGDIFARRFDLNGTQLGRDIVVAGNHLLDERGPRIDSNSAGRFSIAYVSNNLDDTADTLFVRRYNGGGKLLQKKKIATDLSSSTTDDFAGYDVAVDNKKNTRVVFAQDTGTTGFDIFTRTLSSRGVLSRRRIVSNAVGDEFDPVVAVDRVTGQFVVAVFDGNTVVVREFSKKGVLQGTEQTVVPIDAGPFDPSISIDGDGTYFIGFTEFIASDHDVFGQFGDLVP